MEYSSCNTWLKKPYDCLWIASQTSRASLHTTNNFSTIVSASISSKAKAPSFRILNFSIFVYDSLFIFYSYFILLLNSLVIFLNLLLSKSLKSSEISKSSDPSKKWTYLRMTSSSSWIVGTCLIAYAPAFGDSNLTRSYSCKLFSSVSSLMEYYSTFIMSL